MGAYYTTKEKKEYPYIIEITERFEGGIVKCNCYDTDGASREKYNLSELRAYSAEEYWDDIAKFYDLEKPDVESVLSEQFLKYLDKETEEYLAIVKEMEEKADADNIDITDLDSNELWEHDRADEIAGMLSALKEVIEEAKETMEQEKSFFKRQIGYVHAYSDVVIMNATKEEVLTAAREYVESGKSYYADFESVWMDGKVLENGGISFVGYRESPRKLAEFFSTQLPDAIVYTDTSWDYHAFYCYKNGEVCHDYSACWVRSEPVPYTEENDEPGKEYYDCDVLITDHLTGHRFSTGGGRCTETEYKSYCEIIENHPVNTPAPKRGR